MAKRRAPQHRILDLGATLILIVIISTLRATLQPAGDEAVANTATPIGIMLQNLQAKIPTLSAVVWALAAMFAGLSVGRYAAKYSIYPAYTLMAIPVMGVMATAVMVSGDFLVSSVAMLLMLYATKYIHRGIMRTKSFGDLSLAMLCYGAIPLVFAPAAIFYALLPLLVLVIHNSWREWVVSVSSLVFPPLAVCYWSWCAGEEFLTPVKQIYTSLLAESEFHLFSTLNPASILLLGVVIMMVLCAVSLIISDRYSLKVNSRAVMRFNSLLLVACIAMFLLPSCTATIFAIIALPVAMLVPLIFVRMGFGFTEGLYRLMLLAAIINIIAMCWQ
ncbi:MAG: hypothetical protein IKM12_06985 [Alistipes sp.]|nr:hypothetical protein [Alistipes sp.]